VKAWVRNITKGFHRMANGVEIALGDGQFIRVLCDERTLLKGLRNEGEPIPVGELSKGITISPTSVELRPIEGCGGLYLLRLKEGENEVCMEIAGKNINALKRLLSAPYDPAMRRLADGEAAHDEKEGV